MLIPNRQNYSVQRYLTFVYFFTAHGHIQVGSKIHTLNHVREWMIITHDLQVLLFSCMCGAWLGKGTWLIQEGASASPCTISPAWNTLRSTITPVEEMHMNPREHETFLKYHSLWTFQVGKIGWGRLKPLLHVCCCPDPNGNFMHGDWKEQGEDSRPGLCEGVHSLGNWCCWCSMQSKHTLRRMHRIRLVVTYSRGFRIFALLCFYDGCLQLKQLHADLTVS